MRGSRRARLGPLGLRAAIATGVIGAGALATLFGRPGGYGGQRQARFAPPAWAYGPAWTAIELAGADSLARVLESPFGPPERRRALSAAVANDALYALFPLVYFRLRSPLLAAAVTWAQLGAVVVQARASQRVDPAAARGLYPQLGWLALAGPVAVVQALANPDPLLGTRALAPRLGEVRD